MSYEFNQNTQKYVVKKILINDLSFIEGEKLHIFYNTIKSRKAKSLNRDQRRNEQVVLGNNLNIVISNNSIANKRQKNSVELINNSSKYISKEEKEWLYDQNKEVIFPFKDISPLEDPSVRKTHKVQNKYNNMLGLNNKHTEGVNNIFKDVSFKELSNIFREGATQSEINSQLDFYFNFNKNNYDIILTQRSFKKRGCFIDVIETIADINQDYITGEKEKGIYGEINIKSNKKQSLTLKNKTNILDRKKTNYFLEYIEESHLNDNTQQSRSFKYGKRLSNNNISFYYENVSDPIYNKSTELFYKPNIEETIKPFVEKDFSYNSNPETVVGSPMFITKNRYSINNDKIINYYTSKDDNGNIVNEGKNILDFSFDNGDKYNSTGRDVDYSNSNGLESIAYLGEID